MALLDILNRPASIGDYILLGRGGVENYHLGKVINIKNDNLVVFVYLYGRYRYIKNNEFYILDKNDISLVNEYKKLENDLNFQNHALSLCDESLHSPEIAYKRLGGIYRVSLVDGGTIVYLGDYDVKVYERISDDDIENLDNFSPSNLRLKKILSGPLYQKLSVHEQPNIRNLYFNEKIDVLDGFHFNLLTYDDLVYNLAYFYSYMARSDYDYFYENYLLINKPYLKSSLCVGRISDDLLVATSSFSCQEGRNYLLFTRKS